MREKFSAYIAEDRMYTMHSGLSHWKSTLLIALAFLVGFGNTKPYWEVIHLQFLSMPHAVLVGAILFLLIGMLIKGKKNILKYILPLLSLVCAKYIWLFVVNPGLFTVSNPGVGANVAQSYYSLNFPYLAEVSYLFLSFFSCIVVALGVDSFQSLKSTIASFVFGCASASLMGFSFFYNMIGSRETIVDGIFFLGGLWNSSVVSFVSVFWLAVAMLPYLSRVKAWIVKALLFFIVMGTLVGLSRSGFLALLISLAAYMLSSRDKRTKLELAFFVVFLFLIFSLFLTDVISDFHSRFFQYASVRDEVRVQIWADYLFGVSQYWMLGMGGEGHLIYSSIRQGPHSIFLSYFVRFGFLGVLFFLWMLFGALVSIRIIQRVFPFKVVAAIYAWGIAYLCLVAYNETGFITISFYMALGLIMAWGEIASRHGRVASVT